MDGAARLRPRRIEVEIGELVLHGFEATDRYRIRDALARELARMLAAEPHRSIGHGSIERIDAGEVRMQSGARRDDIGTAVARVVHASLAQTSRAGADRASDTRHQGPQQR